MKTKFILLLILSCFTIISCDNNDGEYILVKVASPEYMSLDAFRKSVEITPPSPIIESGKIYAYNDLILINDREKGIHIIDNSQPENPIKIACINIKANNDMEIKGDYLYVDSLMDLVVFDISDLNDIKEVSRLKDVFPKYITLPFSEDLIVDYGDFSYDPDDVIVKWNIREERRKVEDVEYLTIGIFDGVAMAESNSSTTGQGGSLARFKIVNDFLYAVDSHTINIFNINNLETPETMGGVFAGFDIETIFNRGDHLFLGSMRGMYIYDISSPSSPQFVSEFQHGTACDPVVVDDEYAYITLRAGNFCGALDSSLQIVDIKDLYNPVLIKSYSMDNPYGLGVKNNLIFICDGTSGLKVYNKTDIENLILVDHFKDINTFDVIPLEERLLMIGDEALFQYIYADNGLELINKFSLN
ncbi:MAG: hypothetical protein WBN17_11275 [Aureibaculum sp.]